MTVIVVVTPVPIVGGQAAGVGCLDTEWPGAQEAPPHVISLMLPWLAGLGDYYFIVFKVPCCYFLITEAIQAHEKDL